MTILGIILITYSIIDVWQGFEENRGQHIMRYMLRVYFRLCYVWFLEVLALENLGARCKSCNVYWGLDFFFFLNIVFEYWRFSSKPSIMVLFMLENWQGYGITMGFFNGIEVVPCYNQWWKYSIAEFDKNIINIIWEFENSNIYTYILLFFFTCKIISIYILHLSNYFNYHILYKFAFLLF